MATIRERIRDISQRDGVYLSDRVRVVSVRPVGESYVRIVVEGACLSAYRPAFPADAFKLDMGVAGAPAWRALTVRAFDGRRIECDLALHAGTVATRWAGAADRGDEVPLVGFRRDFALGDEADHVLLIADASSLPAAAAILASLPSRVRVDVLAEAPSAADRVILGNPRHATVTWLHHAAPSAGPASPLTTAAGSVEVGAGTEVWLAAEAATVRTIRRRLIEEGLPRTRLHASAYWVAGQTSTERDAHDETVYTRAAESGRDVNDLTVQDELEFGDPVPA